MTTPPALAASMTLTMILVFGILFGLLAGVSYYLNLGVFVMVGFAVGIWNCAMVYWT